MKKRAGRIYLVAGLCWLLAPWSVVAVAGAQPAPCPVAVFPFAERGAVTAGLGIQVADLLFAELVADPELILVERADTNKIYQEQELYLTGLTDPNQALQMGRMTGARVLVSGSVMAVGDRLVILAKIIAAETGRVLGSTVKGPRDADLGALVTQLAGRVSAVLQEQRTHLLPPDVSPEDRIAKLKAHLAGSERPSLSIHIEEEHIGRPVIDPAAETEMRLICQQAGFPLFDSDSQADVQIKGEGFSEYAGQRGNLISVKARVEVTAIDRRSGRIIATDRCTSFAVDLAEHIAAKTALQKVAATVTERMLPLLVDRAP